MSKLRRWRDRKQKIVHAFDPDQDFSLSGVRTLCQVDVVVDYKSPYATMRHQLKHIPPIEKVTADLPKPSTKLTCMSCLALTW